MPHTIYDDLKNKDSEIKKSKILEALESEDLSITFSDALDNEMVLNMGPSHPATHGVLRLLISLDGETVMKCIPDLGYLHRGYEKLAESCSYHEFIPHTDRLDYLQPIANNVGYTMAVEKLLHIDIPERAKYIRVMISELGRIQSHLISIGSMFMDIGATTPFLWAIREREKIMDIYDMFVGARFTTSYTRIGGLANDLNDDALNATKKFIAEFPKYLQEIRDLMERNKVFIVRCEGVGYLSKEDTIEYGVTGPVLRAVGVDRDLRKDDPYLVYDRLSFDVPVFNDGDCLSRYYVRAEEMVQSTRIVEQCLKDLPSGPIFAEEAKKVLPRKEKVYSKMEELIHDFMLINFGVNPPVGESYQAIEASKGELGFYLISDGTGNPFRLKIHSPSFCNIQALPLMLKGGMISDIVVVLGALDPVMGEADK